MVSLCVIILTYNEEEHIGRAIDSLGRLASDIVVVDSGSTDRTAEIARSKGAVVLCNKWINHAKQFQWAIDNLPAKTEWIMRLDADEVVEPDLVARLFTVLPNISDSVTGILLKRKHIFLGRWIRFGGRYPVTLLRIWRHGAARVEQRWMDEHIALIHGKHVVVEGGFSDINLKDISSFISKHNAYATAEAVERLNRKYHLFDFDHVKGIPQQASWKRFLKVTIYDRLPLGTGPLMYFLYRYIILLGFLDGQAGVVYHGLQGLWYRFLVDVRFRELDREIRTLDTRRARLQHLAVRTGLELTDVRD